MNILRKEVLRFKDAKSDKVYEVELVEKENKHYVNFRYGKLGSKLREGTKTKTRVSKKNAHKIVDLLIKEKIKKGYKLWDGKELSEVELIINALKESGEISSDVYISSELNKLEGTVGDIICIVLETLMPEKCINYPNFDGGWVGGTLAQEYLNLINHIINKTNDKLEISNLKVAVDDELLPEDNQEISVSFDHNNIVNKWSFMMDDQNIYFNGVTNWITNALEGAYLYLSNDVGIYGFFLSKKAITKLKDIGVIPENPSTDSGAGYIDFNGKYVSFAVIKELEFFEGYIDELEIYGGAILQMVIDDKTDYVIYHDQANMAEDNDHKLLEIAKKKGKNLLSMWRLQDLVDQFDY